MTDDIIKFSKSSRQDISKSLEPNNPSRDKIDDDKWVFVSDDYILWASKVAGGPPKVGPLNEVQQTTWKHTSACVRVRPKESFLI